MGKLEIEIMITMKKLLLPLLLVILNQLTFAQVDESIKTFTGHTSQIQSVKFSPDGKHIVSGSAGAAVKLWDVATGQCVRTFIGHTENVSSVDFSPNGKNIVSAGGYSDGKDFRIRIWDTNTGQCIKILNGHKGYIKSVAYSPDGNKIVSGDGEGFIKFWDANTGKQLKSIRADKYSIMKVVFSPDGTHYLTCGIRELKIWDSATNKCKMEYSGDCPKEHLDYSPDNKSIFFHDCGPKSMDLITGNVIEEKWGAWGPFKLISGGKRVVSAYSGDIKIWDIPTNKCIKTFVAHSQDINELAVSPDGRLLVSASQDNTIKLWDISKDFNTELADGAGSVEVVSPVGKNYPVLSITNSSIKFADSNGNNTIDAFESCKLTFELNNIGVGNAYKMKARLSAAGTKEGITFSNKDVSILNAGDKKVIEIPIVANANTETGKVTFTIKVDEANGYGTDEYTIEVPTRKYITPLVEVADFTVTGSNGSSLKKKKPFDLQVLVQNTQAGLAEDITVELQVPANVTCLSGNTTQNITTLKAGETKSFVYELIVTDLYTSQIIPITIKLDEKMGKYAQNKSILLNLDQALAADKITVTAKPDEQADISITKGSLNVDVDVNIPTEATAAPHKYALIIGNEDYSSFQTGLSTEVNVDFAVNDAQVFKKYCVQTLGVPDNQVRLIKNGTTSQIKQGLEWINKLAKLENGDAEVIFYYSGHGLPDDATKIAYLMPVDISGANVQEGIKLDDVYSKLTEHPTKRTIVLLDACFSGGARNQGLVAMKGSKLKPRDNSLSGNIVVLSSSTGEESSGVYRTNKHGYFTYFLLKKLQETKGDVTLGDLLNDVKQKVQKQSTLESRPQTPGVNYSPAVNPVWENWKLK
jgi:WD40 repeat protein